MIIITIQMVSRALNSTRCTPTRREWYADCQDDSDGTAETTMLQICKWWKLEIFLVKFKLASRWFSVENLCTVRVQLTLATSRFVDSRDLLAVLARDMQNEQENHHRRLWDWIWSIIRPVRLLLANILGMQLHTVFGRQGYLIFGSKRGRRAG